jgi:TonB family protein
VSELLWTPQEHLGRATWGFAQQSRIRRFLGVSTAIHLAVAALSPWLFLTFALSGREEQLVIRTVDFFPPLEAAGSESAGRGGGGSPLLKPSARAVPAAPAAPAAPASRATPEPTPAQALASPPAPEPMPAPATASVPASPPASEVTPAPVPPAPRDVPTVPTDPRGTAPVPYAAGRPSVPSPSTAEPGRGDAGQTAALARDITGREAGGPRATVDIPRNLVRGSGGGGTSGAGAGTGVGTGVGTGEGAGRAAIGSGSGAIDTGDPDFGEYFRIIERRVRAAWRYPENLGGTTQTVKLGFSLRLDGAVDDVRVVNSTSGVLNESALTAVRKAAPFPPLPAKFRSLVGQPLVMSFTVTIK